MNRLAIILSLILSFVPSLLLAGDLGQTGSVDFAFDGGTIKCEFGTKGPKSERSVAFIVHPASIKTATARKNLILIPGTTGSAVLIVDSDGKHRQLDRKAGAEWAKERVAEMAARRSSVAENAFVAAAMHTLSTGTPVLVWANDGVELLESGNWTGLFYAAPQATDRFPDTGPFADSQDSR